MQTIVTRSDNGSKFYIKERAGSFWVCALWSDDTEFTLDGSAINVGPYETFDDAEYAAIN